MKTYLDLTKFGIVIFTLLAGVAGYATGFQVENPFSWNHALQTMLGLYFLSSGSLALNQVQEWRLDQKMPRTAQRPVASGKITPAAAAILAVSFIFVGAVCLFRASEVAGWVGLVSVFLYNVTYTMFWKPRWVFAAVPGAIPGALPVTIGYAATNPDIFNSESLYLFLVMFLWQMPHFWSLAIRYKEDYAAGGIPTLPAIVGVERTLYHIGLYTFAYVGIAVASPWFVRTSWIYLLFVLPFSFKILQEFLKFFKSKGQQAWFPFFMWTNFSMLVFIFVPVIDKWNFLFINSN